MTIHVVGIGAGNAGDDGVGLAVIEALATLDLGPGVELHASRDPSALVSFVEAGERVIVVDAAVDAGRPGHVRVLSPDDLDASSTSPLSSHGLDVRQALALGTTLAARPARVSVVAVAIEPPKRHEPGLSPAVRAAIPTACDLVRGLLAGE